MLSASKLIRSIVFIFPAILSAQQLTVIQHPLPTVNTEAIGIALGSDGALWYTNNEIAQIGRITTAGAITEYAVTGDPIAITAGPDGALWFAEFNANQIGRITTAGAVTYYPVSGNPSAITKGPDGALWFTEYNGSKIGRITTSGAVTTYPVPNGGENGITTGPDGALWFTEFSDFVVPYGNNIGRITTSGVVTEYPLPHSEGGMTGITTGPDGALWFCESYYNQIGRITTAGVISEYPAAGPQQITSDVDGSLWFTQNGELGRITTAGVVTEYPVVSNAGPGLPEQGIAALPKGALWFCAASRVDQVVVPTATLTAGLTSAGPGTKLPVSGSGFNSGEVVNLFPNSTGDGILGSVIAGADGSLAAMVKLPPLPYGAGWSIVAVGESSGKIGVASFSISPLLVIGPGTALPGGAAGAIAFGFDEGETVQFYFGSPRVYVGSAQTDAFGSIPSSSPLKFTIPAGAQAGENVVFGQGEFSKAIGKGYIEIQ